MKKLIAITQLFILGGLLFVSPVQAEDDDKAITHYVKVWLNKGEDENIRKEFVKISETLNDLPGVIYRHVGVVSKSERKIADNDFDVAITATLKNKAALNAYLNHPKHKEVMKKIKPMVKKAQASDSITP